MNPQADPVAMVHHLRAGLGAAALTRAAAGLAIVFFVIIPLANVIRLDAAIWTVCVLVVVLLSARLEFRDRDAKFVIAGSLMIFLVAQVLVALAFQTEPYSDFETQWAAAVQWSRSGLSLPPEHLQTQRALPFFYPLALVFGTSDAVYVVANVVLTSLTFLMSVWIARRYFGWSAAAKTGVLLVFAYEAYVVNTLPSHDVVGAFGMVLFLFLLAEWEHFLCASRSRFSRVLTLAGAGLAIGLTITWTDWQRSTGVFCLAAIVFYAALSALRRSPWRWNRIALGGIAIATSAVTMAQLEKRQLLVPMPPTHITSTEMNLVAFSGYDSNGRFSDKARKAPLISSMEPSAVVSLSRAMFAETVRTAPIEKYQNFVVRSADLLRFGKESYWYFRYGQSNTPVSVDGYRRVYDTVRNTIAPVFWAILLLVCVTAIARRDVLFDARLIPFLLLVPFFPVMGMLGEVQSRYSFFALYLIAIYAGTPWFRDPLGRGGESEERKAGRLATGLVSHAAVIGMGLAGVFWLSPHLYHASLVNFDGAERTPSRDVAGISVEQNLLTVAGVPPALEGRSFTISRSLEAKLDEDNTLRFVVRNQSSDDEAEPHIPGRALEVLLDGEEVSTIDLTTTSPARPVAVAGVSPGKRTVTLRLQPGRDIGSGSVETTIAYLGFY